MRNTKTQTLSTIAGVIRKYKKKYCVASQEKIIELLENWYGTEIKVRALNYHLADLREWKMIKSIKRTHRKKDGTLVLQTTATCITPLGYYELAKLGCEWALKKYNELIKRYFPKPVVKIDPPEKYDKEEHRRRRALGREIFKTEEYRRAFGLN